MNHSMFYKKKPGYLNIMSVHLIGLKQKSNYKMTYDIMMIQHEFGYKYKNI